MLKWWILSIGGVALGKGLSAALFKKFWKNLFSQFPKLVDTADGGNTQMCELAKSFTHLPTRLRNVIKLLKILSDFYEKEKKIRYI